MTELSLSKPITQSSGASTPTEPETVGSKRSSPQTALVYSQNPSIVYKGTTKNVDLFAGEATPGTAVILHDGWNGPNQIWRFEEVA